MITASKRRPVCCGQNSRQIRCWWVLLKRKFSPWIYISSRTMLGYVWQKPTIQSSLKLVFCNCTDNKSNTIRRNRSSTMAGWNLTNDLVLCFHFFYLSLTDFHNFPGPAAFLQDNLLPRVSHLTQLRILTKRGSLWPWTFNLRKIIGLKRLANPPIINFQAQTGVLL